MKRLTTFLLAAACTLVAAAQTRITDIRVQNSHEPIAVEDRQPDFGWRMESDRRGAAQTAWRLQVTRDSDGSEVWDSGRVDAHRASATAEPPCSPRWVTG